MPTLVMGKFHRCCKLFQRNKQLDKNIYQQVIDDVNKEVIDENEQEHLLSHGTGTTCINSSTDHQSTS